MGDIVLGDINKKTRWGSTAPAGPYSMTFFGSFAIRDDHLTRRSHCFRQISFGGIHGIDFSADSQSPSRPEGRHGHDHVSTIL